MYIQILEPDSDITQPSYIVVVIDVFRAFSTNRCIADKRSEKLIAIDSVFTAIELKHKYGEIAKLVGERQGIKIDGFDYGNSPTEIIDTEIENQIVIHTTTAETKGLLRQNPHVDVICDSFVNSTVQFKSTLKPGITKTLRSTAQPASEQFTGRKIIFSPSISNRGCW